MSGVGSGETGWREGVVEGGSPLEGLSLLSRAAVIAEAYSQLCQASGRRWQVRTLCS